MFGHLKMEIALAILASNQRKIETNNSATQQYHYYTFHMFHLDLPNISTPQHIADLDLLTSPEKNKSSYILSIHPD